MVLSIPVHEIFLNYDFPFDLQKCNMKKNYVLCHIEQPGFYTMDLRFDEILCDEETQVMQDMP